MEQTKPEEFKYGYCWHCVHYTAFGSRHGQCYSCKAREVLGFRTAQEYFESKGR